MAEVKKLTRFHMEEDGEGFRLRLEDEAGGLFEVVASYDQMDVIADSLDELLDEDDEFVADDDDEASDEETGLDRGSASAD